MEAWKLGRSRLGVHEEVLESSESGNLEVKVPRFLETMISKRVIQLAHSEVNLLKILFLSCHASQAGKEEAKAEAQPGPTIRGVRNGLG